MNKILLKLEEKTLIFLSLVMIFGGLIYYFYQLNWLGTLLTLILSLVSFRFIQKRIKVKVELEPEISITETKKSKRINFALKGIYLALVLVIFLLLLRSVSDEALISPWQVIPKVFFLLYFIATTVLFLILNKAQSNKSLILIRLHYFISFAIAAIVYQIGYGFDPFIHTATMELIDTQGAVEPKTVYYLGQYSLIVIFHKITALPIYYLNKFLVPVLAALFLPKALFSFLKNKGLSQKYLILTLVALALPLNLFILSTPQNLTYIWLLLTIFYSLSTVSKIIPFLLALATLAIHPLSGLPAIFFVTWPHLRKIKNKVSHLSYKLINIFYWLASALVLPLAFVSVESGSWKNLSFNPSNLLKLSKNTPAGDNIADLLLNLPYLFNNSWLFIFIILSLIGFFIWYKKNRAEVLVFLKIISALIIALILSASLDFSFLIDYERDAYIARLPILIALFSLPALILALDRLVLRIFKQTKVEIISALILIVIAIISALYLSYPRLDAYHNSKGYSVSSSDLEAVRLIKEKSNLPYIVLANQQTSVASLKELGFDNYFSTPLGKVFFYPIPTGGELYSYYLEMVNEKPTKETMKKAMDLVGVRESYFVVSKYWWLSDRIIAAAKISATQYYTTSNEDIYIFKYTN